MFLFLKISFHQLYEDLISKFMCEYVSVCVCTCARVQVQCMPLQFIFTKNDKAVVNLAALPIPTLALVAGY